MVSSFHTVFKKLNQKTHLFNISNYPTKLSKKKVTWQTFKAFHGVSNNINSKSTRFDNVQMNIKEVQNYPTFFKLVFKITPIVQNYPI